MRQRKIQKKKVSEREQRERGRRVYNFRCYFCHGYSGDARTTAAQVLSPKPRDFTAGGLTAADVIEALRQGRSGTAMRSFQGILSSEEMEAVAAFIIDEFVTRKAPNTVYHTAENGWPEHRRRYGAAYPYVLGKATPGKVPTAGSRLYLSSCVNCHQPQTAAPAWERAPR